MIYVSSDPRSEVLDRATSLLREDPEISIGELSRLCSVSESTLYGLFKRYLGKTPNCMRNSIRCEKARLLLETTDMPVEEISRVLGFSSSSYFRKIFFEHTHSTPRDVRKNARHI
jgi:AraC-like DNA-binding protein